MIAIQFKFPAGRFHATPWDRQVNEGAVEWPPSLWRILRALVAVWHHKLPDVSEAEMRDIISALNSPPCFRLPPATQGHTRHYMPAEFDKKTKVFDTFVSLDRQSAVVACWSDATLNDEQRGLLSRLLRCMTFFGRAESWVDAELLEHGDIEPNAIPASAAMGEGAGFERIRLLSPMREQAHISWRRGEFEQQVAAKLANKQVSSRARGKSATASLTKKEREAIEALLPQTVFDALHAESTDLRKNGWNRPPGSEWIEYLRPSGTFALLPRRVQASRKISPTVARYAISGAVRPRLTDAIWIGERARQMMMGCSRAASGNASPVFSGKSVDGQPIRGFHQHAHFLCESAGRTNRGEITHLCVYAPIGFSHEDTLAISRLRKLWGHGGHDMQLVLLGIGQPGDFGGTDEFNGQSRILAASKTWRSRTPFVSPHFLHIRKSELKNPSDREAAIARELRRIVRAELTHRPWLSEHADSVQIEPVFGRDTAGTRLGGAFTRWLKFRCERKLGDGRHGDSSAFGLQLTFPSPVRGPIALGYGCHFGLGQFEPVGD